MSEPQKDVSTSAAPRAVSRRTLELGVAGALFAVGGVVIFDSQRLGAGWASDGPQAGYFPFYIGALLCAVSALIAAASWRSREQRQELFLNSAQFGLVLRLFVPLLVYVALLSFLGIYLASWLFMMFFMWRSGGTRWWTTLVTASTTVIALFAMFELWFKVPLPKGPLEVWFGLA